MKKTDPDAPVTTQIFQEGIDAVISAMDNMIGDTNRNLNEKFKYLDNKIDNVSRDLKREIRDLKTDTVTQKEFNLLKAKVDRHLLN